MTWSRRRLTGMLRDRAWPFLVIMIFLCTCPSPCPCCTSKTRLSSMCLRSLLMWFQSFHCSHSSTPINILVPMQTLFELRCSTIRRKRMIWRSISLRSFWRRWSLFQAARSSTSLFIWRDSSTCERCTTKSVFYWDRELIGVLREPRKQFSVLCLWGNPAYLWDHQ